MGDRTTCTLTLHGILWEKHIPELAAAIETAGGESYASRSLAEALKNQECCFAFYEVNYGTIDDSLATCLDRLGLSYEWRWDPGGDYPAGIEITDALSGKRYNHYIINGEIAITLTDIDNPEQIAEARAARAFIADNTPLLVVSSAHHLLNLRSEGAVTAAQVDAFQKCQAGQTA